MQIGVVETRALAQLAIPGLELLRRFAILHDGVDPRTDFLHLFEIGIFEGRQHLLRRQFLARQLHDLGADPPRIVRA